MAEDGYRVTAKSRACDNPVVRERFEERDATRGFESRSAAEAFATRASRRGGVRVEVQAAAPQDPTDCHAYLVAIPARHTDEPANPGDDYWRFHTDANQQGGIGELLATTPRTDPPAFTWYVRQDLGDPEDLVVRVETATEPVAAWQPDCRLDAVVAGAVERTYRCEVKTGAASFQRGQRAGMDEAAATGHVLTARVHIDRLPDEYTVHVAAYDPD